MKAVLFLSLVLLPAALVADDQPLGLQSATPAKLTPEEEAKVRAQIKEIESKPEDKITGEDRIRLSQDYLRLNHATFAVRNANAALEMDRDNQDAWVALIKAQCLNLHEVVYAEENYQHALKKFPNSEKIAALNLDLFYGQMKFGQPFVAAKHLLALVTHDSKVLAKRPDKSHEFVENTKHLVEEFERARAPESALEQVQTQLEKLQKDLPQEAADGLKPVIDQIASFRKELLKRYQQIRAAVAS